AACANELFQARADPSVVRTELIWAEVRDFTRTEQNMHPLRHPPLQSPQLLVVEAELEDVGRLRGACQLRVERLVAPRAKRRRRLCPEEEVGDSAPPALAEDTLINHVDAR